MTNNQLTQIRVRHIISVAIHANESDVEISHFFLEVAIVHNVRGEMEASSSDMLPVPERKIYIYI